MHLTLAFDRYKLQQLANGRSQHTIAQAERHVMQLYQWMIRELGGTSLDLLGHEELAKFLTSDAVTKKSNGGPKKPSSLNVLRSTLRAFFSYCADAGITPGNPARLVKRAVVGEPVPRALSDREVDALRAALAQAKSPSEKRDRLLVELLLATGIRIGSALGLEVGDVELDERRLWLRVVKRGRQQVVAFDTELAGLLREHIAGRMSGWVFESLAGAPLTSRTAQRRLAIWAHKAGIKRIVTQHQIRHTFATRLLQRTGDIEAVRESLGHVGLGATTRYVRAAATLHRFRPAVGAPHPQ